MTSDFFQHNASQIDIIERSSGLSPSWSQENFLSPLPRKWELSLAALCCGEFVGFAIASQKTPACAHLHRLAVASSIQRQGVAQAFLHTLQSMCRHDYDFLSLFVEQPALCKFYEKRGFSPLREAHGKVFMACPL